MLLYNILLVIDQLSELLVSFGHLGELFFYLICLLCECFQLLFELFVLVL